MHLSWRQRLEQRPALRDFREWPVVPQEGLSSEARKHLVRNEQIVARVLAGDAQNAVARALGVTPARVTQLLNRCLGGNADTDPALSDGLVAHRTTVAKARTAELPTVARPSGTHCAFTRLLEEAPRVAEGVDEMIRAALADRHYGQRLTPRIVHDEFKRLLAEIDWPRERYPYTHASRAYDSVRRYYHRRRAELAAERERRRHVERLPRPAFDPRALALRAIQIDEHLLDLPTRLHLQLNDVTIALRLARASVLSAVDCATQCVLGYHLALTRAPNQDDLLALIDACIQPRALPVLTTPGLSYAPGAAFPCTLEPAFPVTVGEVALDNAWMHRARSVIDLLVDALGASVHYGPPATPTARSTIESVFGYIARVATHRSAATSGTGPGDPWRESKANAAKVPPITVHALDDALAVVLTERNVTPQAALGGLSPLELYRRQVGETYVAYTHPLRARQWQPFASAEQRTVRCHGRQRHINFGGQRYTGAALTQPLSGGKTIWVHYDRRDIRTLHAYSSTGRDLGRLEVARPWRRFAHSLALRRHILREVQRHRLDARDPMGAHFRYLLDHRGEAKNDLQLARIYNQYTADGAAGLIIGEKRTVSPPNPGAFVWSPGIADRSAR